MDYRFDSYNPARRGPPHRPRLTDFPLRVESLGLDESEVTRIRQQHAMEQQRAKSQAQARAAQKALKPIVTLVSALPPTTYKDEADKTPKTATYINAQVGALKWLKTNPADRLTPATACLMTQSLDPIAKEPCAEEALRFCYYLRSIGFDVYPELEKKILCLYVVHPGSNVRGGGGGADNAYWVQDFSTGQVQHALTQAPGDVSRMARRNALTADMDADRLYREHMQMAAQQGFPFAPATPPQAQPPLPQAQVQDTPASARTVLETSLTQAQARLNIELARANPRDE
jgi:hypothetical protein